MPKKPALDPRTLTPESSSSYPEPNRSRVMPREQRSARGLSGNEQSRPAGGTTHYSDADVDLVWNGPLAPGKYGRRDGTQF
jgi:hypothetical protein